MSASVSDTRRFAAASHGRSVGRRAIADLRRATGLTGAGAILLTVAVVAWVSARIAGGRPLYLLAYAALVVLIGAWLVSRRPLPVSGRRSEARPRLREGETVRMQVTLTAERRASTFVLEERLPPSLGVSTRVAVAGAEPGESVKQAYQLTALRRGVFRIGPLVARWGDPFGLTERETVLADQVELLVHPSIEPVADRPLTRLWEDPPIRPPISKPWPSGMEFYGMRDYRPGDDLRRVVWRAFARTGRLLVREAEQGITDRITMVLDTARRSHTPGDPSDSFEAGVKAAASLGIRHLGEGYSVTLEGNAERLAGPLRGREIGRAHV